MKADCLVAKLRAGGWVEVRSREEILATLDARARLQGLPFMPEMFQYCGRRFRIYKRAHKTCDTVNASSRSKGLRMQDAYHLDGVRCDGQAHGGCEAACLVFWKSAWLKPVQDNSTSSGSERQAGCTEAQVLGGTRRDDETDPNVAYSCQATELPMASQALPWWNLGQYVEDLASRNIGLGTLLRGVTYMSYQSLIQAGVGLGGPLRWFYDVTAGLRRGYPYPRRKGLVSLGDRTPTMESNLQPGDWVRVKSYQEILSTLDSTGKNRGLYFDAEMVPYCNRVYRVLKRVNRIIDEPTGRMQELKASCIVLEGVVCEARYSECRLFCPRAIYSYWREIWLERVDPPRGQPVSTH